MINQLISWITGKPKVIKVQLPEGFDQLEVIQANRWWA